MNCQKCQPSPPPNSQGVGEEAADISDYEMHKVRIIFLKVTITLSFSLGNWFVKCLSVLPS